VLPTATDFELLCMINKLNDQDYVLTEGDGEISAIGRQFAKCFKVAPRVLAEKMINI